MAKMKLSIKEINLIIKSLTISTNELRHTTKEEWDGMKNLKEKLNNYSIEM